MKLTFPDYEDVRSGVKYLECTRCSGRVSIRFDGNVEVILQDGISGGWMSKAMKENRLRAVRREVIGKRERDHVFTPHLVPNVNGELTGTWKEAKGYAGSKGLNTSSYDRLMRKEGK
jgi:hypothetical protein